VREKREGEKEDMETMRDRREERQRERGERESNCMCKCVRERKYYYSDYLFFGNGPSKWFLSFLLCLLFSVKLVSRCHRVGLIVTKLLFSSSQTPMNNKLECFIV
jgi:hypothetical protein